MAATPQGLQHRFDSGSPTDLTESQPTLPGVAVQPGRDDVVVLLLVDLQPGSRWWGFSRLVLGQRSLHGPAGLRFARVLGSGHEGGFGLRPSATRQGLFAVFDGEVAADAFIDGGDVLRRYRDRASECCVIKLRAWSSRGSWGGQAIGVTTQAPASGPIAALTRASIRPFKALEFWRQAPPAQVSLEASPGCRLAAGLGEAPLLRQATFSVWDSVQAMDAYARQGAHLDAIRRSAQGNYFSESMFVRFAPLAIRGDWKGRHFD